MILKQRLQQRQLAFYTSDDFLQHVFSRVEKLCKEEINKLKIKMESEKKNKLKKIRKPPFLLSQKESNREQVNK